MEAGDAEELYALSDANRAYLSEFMPWAAGQTFADYPGARRLLPASARPPTTGLTARSCATAGSSACVGYHSVSWQHRSTSIGYWLAESEQGRGTMTLAARALVDHAFAVWDLNRVEIAAAVDNARSRALARRLGFTEEGTRRQAERVATATWITWSTRCSRPSGRGVRACRLRGSAAGPVNSSPRLDRIVRDRRRVPLDPLPVTVGRFDIPT